MKRKSPKTTQRARSLKSRRPPTTTAPFDRDAVAARIAAFDMIYAGSEGVEKCRLSAETKLAPRADLTTPVRMLSKLSSAERKTFPMAGGLMDYFPDALAYVAHVSWRGNNKHNPGEPLHWARGKSMDHSDCIVRHHQEHGSFDPEGVRHTGQLAWRALALLQEELERDLNLSTPRGATDPLP